MTSCRLNVKVIPSSSRDVITGWLGDALKLKVRAPAEKGRANKSVEELLAKKLGLAKRFVTIVSGKSSGTKVVEVSSMTYSDLLKQLPPV